MRWELLRILAGARDKAAPHIDAQAQVQQLPGLENVDINGPLDASTIEKVDAALHALASEELEASSPLERRVHVVAERPGNGGLRSLMLPQAVAQSQGADFAPDIDTGLEPPAGLLRRAVSAPSKARYRRSAPSTSYLNPQREETASQLAAAASSHKRAVCHQGGDAQQHGPPDEVTAHQQMPYPTPAQSSVRMPAWPKSPSSPDGMPERTQEAALASTPRFQDPKAISHGQSPFVGSLRSKPVSSVGAYDRQHAPLPPQRPPQTQQGVQPVGSDRTPATQPRPRNEAQGPPLDSKMASATGTRSIHASLAQHAPTGAPNAASHATQIKPAGIQQASASEKHPFQHPNVASRPAMSGQPGSGPQHVDMAHPVPGTSHPGTQLLDSQRREQHPAAQSPPRPTTAATQPPSNNASGKMQPQQPGAGVHQPLQTARPVGQPPQAAAPGRPQGRSLQAHQGPESHAQPPNRPQQPHGLQALATQQVHSTVAPHTHAQPQQLGARPQQPLPQDHGQVAPATQGLPHNMGHQTPQSLQHPVLQQPRGPTASAPAVHPPGPATRPQQPQGARPSAAQQAQGNTAVRPQGQLPQPAVPLQTVAAQRQTAQQPVQQLKPQQMLPMQPGGLTSAVKGSGTPERVSRPKVANAAPGLGSASKAPASGAQFPTMSKPPRPSPLGSSAKPLSPAAVNPRVTGAQAQSLPPLSKPPGAASHHTNAAESGQQHLPAASPNQRPMAGSTPVPVPAMGASRGEASQRVPARQGTVPFGQSPPNQAIDKTRIQPSAPGTAQVIGQATQPPSNAGQQSPKDPGLGKNVQEAQQAQPANVTPSTRPEQALRTAGRSPASGKPEQSDISAALAAPGQAPNASSPNPARQPAPSPSVRHEDSAPTHSALPVLAHQIAPDFRASQIGPVSQEQGKEERPDSAGSAQRTAHSRSSLHRHPAIHGKVGTKPHADPKLGPSEQEQGQTPFDGLPISGFELVDGDFTSEELYEMLTAGKLPRNLASEKNSWSAMQRMSATVWVEGDHD